MTLPCLVVAWLGGVYLQSMLQAPAWSLGLALPLPIAVVALWWREGRVRLAASCCLFLLLGALRYNAAVPTFDQDDLGYYNDQGAVTVTGVVVEAPDVRGRYVNLKVSARSVEIDGETRDVEGLALVRTGRYPSYSYGDELEIRGSLQTPPESEDFSYKDYLARQGVHSLIDFGRITVLSRGHGDPFHRIVYALKAHLQETIARLFPEPSASLLTGILLGIETGIPDDLLEDFNATSTTHIIAISWASTRQRWSPSAL
jgi:competence protein ComEC